MPKNSSAKIRLVKRPILTGLGDFLRYILGSESQVDVGIAVIEYLMKHGSFAAANWKFFIENTGCSVGMYTRTLATLKQAGLVERRTGQYILSGDFVGTLERLVAFWEDVRRKAKSATIEKREHSKMKSVLPPKGSEPFVVRKPIITPDYPSDNSASKEDKEKDLTEEIE